LLLRTPYAPIPFRWSLEIMDAAGSPPETWREARAAKARRAADEEPMLDAACAGDLAAWLIDQRDPRATAGLCRSALAVGQPLLARAVARAAVASGVHDAAVMRALGTACLRVRDYAGAADALRSAVALAREPDALVDLAAASVHLGEFDAAVTLCQEVLAVEPSHPGAANNLGVARNAQGKFELALRAFELAMRCGSDDAHLNFGATALLLGEYRAGWPHYGWETARRRANPVSAALPMWDGTAPAKRLLVWPEQGIGDTIQMVRFLERARRTVGSICLACPPGTRDLFRTVAGIDELVDVRDAGSLERFDSWLPTIRLPVVFDVEPDAIPAAPYLRIDPRRREKFARRLVRGDAARIGLVWSGNPQHAWDEQRSCRPAECEPLCRLPGISWFALTPTSACDGPTDGLPINPINADISDFADTAAIVADLDLVITVDTAVAHLCGALGRPAWVLLPKLPDWRWGRNGDRSHWYPTLRLFRQADDGTWPPVIASVATALRDFPAVMNFRSPA
jgi:Flp pilus assembly protein TadD